MKSFFGNKVVVVVVENHKFDHTCHCQIHCFAIPKIKLLPTAKYSIIQLRNLNQTIFKSKPLAMLNVHVM